MTLPEPVASVRGLRVTAGGRALLTRVSFDLTPGRVLAVVGPSGSGKTTAALALLGEHPTGTTLSGTVTVAGSAVAPGSPAPPGTVAYVPQHPSAVLTPASRVGRVLDEIARRHLDPPPASGHRERRRHTRAAADDALSRAGLSEVPGLRRRFPHQLSGGQQQRLVLAHALLSRARVVVADEPTTGLDAVTRDEVADELKALADHGIAVLLLCHDLDVVRRTAHDILVLHAGRVVEHGPADRVLTNPQAEWTRTLVAADRRARAEPGTRAPLVGSTAPTSSASFASSLGAARLTVEGLTARHGTGRRRTVAVDGATLRVAPGECLAVVGRSGSGKTTLARCLVGLHTPSAGRVRLGDRDLAPALSGRSRTELARIQYVFQDTRASFDPGRPVLEQVARSAVRLRGAEPTAARDAARDALARMGVDAATSARHPYDLSGGEIRRAGLARALAADPDVLLCDEITAGLDAVARDVVLDHLDALRREAGVAVLMITHEPEVVARLADRVVVLDAGRIVDEGPATELRLHPRHPLTAALLPV